MADTRLADALVSLICPRTAISAAVQQIDVKFCMVVELRSQRVFSPFRGVILSGLQIWSQERDLAGQFGASRYNS